MIEQILLDKLRSYIIQNNPELMLRLQKELVFTSYLEEKVSALSGQLSAWVSEDKPQHVIEELGINALTADLKPSRFNYLKEIFEEEFPNEYARFREVGVLTYELSNMCDYCKAIFDRFSFSEENEDDRLLHYEVTGALSDYLNGIE